MSNALDHYIPSEIIEIGFTPISGLADRCYHLNYRGVDITLDIASDGYMTATYRHFMSDMNRHVGFNLVAYRSVHTNLWAGDNCKTPSSLADCLQALKEEINARLD